MTIAQEQFIIKCIKKYKSVDSCHSEFHKGFLEKFGGTTKMTVYDTICVNKAMSKLQKMHSEGKLQRCMMIYDFKIAQKPSWGYSYWLS